jgi:hypothetical protein
MVKSTVDPALEHTVTAREATIRAQESNTDADIDNAISEWKVIVEHANFDQIKPEIQAENLNLYIPLLVMRWSPSKWGNEFDQAITALENALSKLGYKPSQPRHDTAVSLGEAYHQRYNVMKVDEDIVQAIRFWEDAHGLSIALHRSKQAV